jgi:transcriptional regulator with XRE-family HTH domain
VIVTSRKTIVDYKRHLLASRGSFEISKKAFKDRLLDARLAMSVRERRTVGQAELARLVGVTPQAWSLWEQGTEPDYERLPRIAEVLGTTVAQLMQDDPAAHVPIEGKRRSHQLPAIEEPTLPVREVHPPKKPDRKRRVQGSGTQQPPAPRKGPPAPRK